MCAIAVALEWSSIFDPGVQAFQIKTVPEGSKMSSVGRLENETIQDPQPKRVCAAGVYLNQTGKCYERDTEGPCGAMMKVTLSSDNKMLTGSCTCKIFPPDGPTACETRPTLFWSTNKQCYFMFDQGPCKVGEWLVLSEKKEPKCQKIPCPEKYDHGAPLLEPSNKPYLNFTFEYRGNCYATQTQGFCSSGKQVAYFPKGSLLPKCTDESNRFCASVRTITRSRFNSCGNGQQPDDFGGCEPTTQLK
ncbi:unnamed protein product [Allacma fusca]|uniref:DUF4789 domain-containing protein n=1 Tax=Allacma fusca TaxID=39272 RepID=A0A8J2KR73_9HEXA|nr:unnamed protein product [Allacma fusca]